METVDSNNDLADSTKTPATSSNMLTQVEQREASMLQQLQLEMSTLVDEMATQRECSVLRIMLRTFMLCCSDATHEALTVQVQSSRASEADTATALEEAQSVQSLPQLHRNIKLCCLQELRAALTAHEIMHQRAMELEVTYCS